MNRIALMVMKNIIKVPGMWTKLCRYAKHTDDYPEQEKWDHISYIMSRGVMGSNVDLQVSGVENIPAPGSGGFMLYGNHQGLFDVVAIAATCKTPIGCVMKKELIDVPLLKQIYRCTNSFGMDREDVRQSLTVIQSVTREVQSGRGYLIFPEGTRSRNGNVMGEFHGGSFRCALKAKCPIIPFAVVNSFKVLDEDGCAPVTVHLQYLDPIPYEEYKDLKTVDLADLVKSRIQAAIDRCTAE